MNNSLIELLIIKDESKITNEIVEESTTREEVPPDIFPKRRHSFEEGACSIDESYIVLFFIFTFVLCHTF